MHDSPSDIWHCTKRGQAHGEVEIFGNFGSSRSSRERRSLTPKPSNNVVTWCYKLCKDQVWSGAQQRIHESVFLCSDKELFVLQRKRLELKRRHILQRFKTRFVSRLDSRTGHYHQQDSICIKTKCSRRVLGGIQRLHRKTGHSCGTSKDFEWYLEQTQRLLVGFDVRNTSWNASNWSSKKIRSRKHESVPADWNMSQNKRTQTKGLSVIICLSDFNWFEK